MRLLTIPALMLSMLATSACYVDLDSNYGTDHGDLTIRYTFDGRRCGAAGVDRISIRVVGQRHRDRYVDALDCFSFEHGVTIENLIEDTYDVDIEARAPNGDVLYTIADTVRVRAFTHQEYDFDAVGVQGDLTFYWTFEGRGACDAVDEVRVRLVDPSGYLYDDATYGCDFGGLAYDAVPAGRWFVSLDAMSFGGRLLYRAVDRPLDVVSGASNTYTIDLAEVF